jgi:hypothetical protein
MTAPCCLRPMPDRAVTKPRMRINHGLHLFLTIFIWHKSGPKQKAITRNR